MIITLNEQQMLKTWRLGARLEPALAECSVERFDGLEVDNLLRRAMRDWYLKLLATADPTKVRIGDITDRVTVEPDGFRRYRLEPKADVVRITGVTMAGQPVELPLLDATADSDRGAIAELANRFRRSGPTPVAVVGADRRWTLTGVDGDLTDGIKVRGVVDPGDETYVLDESALADIQRAAAEAIETL